MLTADQTERIHQVYADPSFMRRFRHTVATALNSRGRHHQDLLDDIVSETFLAASEALAKGSASPRNLEPWIMGVGRTLAHKARVARSEDDRRRVCWEEIEAEELASGVAFDPALVHDPDDEPDSISHPELRAAVLTLSSRDQALLYMLYREGVSLREAGRREGHDHMAVARRHERIIRALRRELGLPEDQPIPEPAHEPLGALGETPPYPGWVQGKGGTWGSATWLCGLCAVLHSLPQRRCGCAVAVAA